MEVCRLLGREESGIASELDSHLLRLLTPVLKLYTGKQVRFVHFVTINCHMNIYEEIFTVLVLSQAIAVVSEGLESFGGQGYIEDTGLPGLLRDAQVMLLYKLYLSHAQLSCC